MTTVDASRRVVLGLIAWTGVPLLHGICMVIDWKLRDPRNPTVGGIPNTLMITFQWTTLALFGMLVFFSLGRIRWLIGRGLAVIFCTTLAFAAMVFGWLYYVIRMGIDTL